MSSEKTDTNEQGAVKSNGDDPVATPTLPPPRPNPSTDPKLIYQARTPPPPHAIPSESNADLFKLSPLTALNLLSDGIESLVCVTGDVPPTPPPSNPPVPNMTGMQREKAAIVRSHSEKNLARLQQQAQQQQQQQEKQQQQENQSQQPQPQPQPQPQAQQYQPVDGVHLRHAPPPPAAAPQPYIIIGEHSQPLNLQHGAITRKFFSKAPPPISIRDYLLRIHQFCPMSTAVYLATSFYIFRLAVHERAIPVTSRNCHRLVLAGLRVAMKALEDLSYPHGKIAKVGGVSEVELARLEISFCFLAGFELVVNEETLRDHWQMLKQDTTQKSLDLAAVLLG